MTAVTAQALSAVITVPVAKPKVPVVQATISASPTVKAAEQTVKVNAPETTSSTLPLSRRTISQPGLLRIGAVSYGCRSP